MKKKHIGLLLIIPIIIIAFLFNSKMQKDNWVKESPEIKYSEERIEEVWGGVLRGDNPDLFYGTPLYDAADAMSGLIYFRNEEKIEKLIEEIPKEYINYQEGNYGMTIGHFALTVSNLKAVRLLLDRGLNPNLMDKDGDAIIIDINGPFISRMPEGLGTLKYMIKKGADVNIYSEKAFTTPLIEAAKYNFENVKLLVNSGANPHFIKELFSEDHSYSNYISPLESALMYKRIEIVNYLIFDQKVDFRTLKYPMDSKFHPGEYEILHNLREMFFELNSKRYLEKMKLVAYLKTQGLDYWKTPIQERYKNNPNYTQDYLSKY
jgi:hypothetical protein